MAKRKQKLTLERKIVGILIGTGWFIAVLSWMAYGLDILFYGEWGRHHMRLVAMCLPLYMVAALVAIFAGRAVIEWIFKKTRKIDIKLI